MATHVAGLNVCLVNDGGERWGRDSFRLLQAMPNEQQCTCGRVGLDALACVVEATGDGVFSLQAKLVSRWQETPRAHTSSQAAAMELLELNNAAQMDFSSLLQSGSFVRLHSFQTTANCYRMVDEGFYDEAHGIDIVYTQVHSKRKACLNEDETIAMRRYEAYAKREYRKQCRARKQG
ncbi:hypothetical protein L7F22_036501 [Adiantum nelumboides]|nr:hypothetical protein [Adiantum nelumboides]